MSGRILCPTAVIQTSFRWEATCFQSKKDNTGSDAYVKRGKRSKYPSHMMRLSLWKGLALFRKRFEVLPPPGIDLSLDPGAPGMVKTSTQGYVQKIVLPLNIN